MRNAFGFGNFSRLESCFLDSVLLDTSNTLHCVYRLWIICILPLRYRLRPCSFSLACHEVVWLLFQSVYVFDSTSAANTVALTLLLRLLSFLLMKLLQSCLLNVYITVAHSLFHPPAILDWSSISLTMFNGNPHFFVWSDSWCQSKYNLIPIATRWSKVKVVFLLSLE